MTRAALVSICLAFLFAAGCFDAPEPACSFLCGLDDACPDGYTCAPEADPDGERWCKRDDVDPTFICSDTTPTTIDAAVVTDADTTPDATPAIDATPPDAAAVDAGFALGSSCTTGDDCNSGFCSDSVCCDAACTGDCDACSTAAGSGADGSCDLLGVSVVCRADSGDCDVAETCTGASADCPSDAFETVDTACGSATDDACTDPDTCNATGTCLPNDEAGGSPCGDTGIDCLVDDTCDGSGACTDNGFEAMSTACGPGVAEPTCDPDVCDAVGVCTDVASAPDETACTEVSSGDCCSGVCTDTSGSGDMCP